MSRLNGWGPHIPAPGQLDFEPRVRRLTITVMVENRAPSGLVAEHGLALWIEADASRILLDTGAGAALLPNAAALGVRLGDVDMVVLSHGHADHTGGLASVLAQRGDLPVVHQPDVTRRRYSSRRAARRDIGMPLDSVTALQAGVQRVPSSLAECIAPGVWVSGRIVRGDLPGAPDPHLWRDAAATEPDPLDDDQCLVIEHAVGRVLCSGCGHAGIVTMLDQVTRCGGARPIAAVVGGLHLAHADGDYRSRVANDLHARGVLCCALGHCTGSQAEDLFAARWGDDFHSLQTGDRLELDPVGAWKINSVANVH